MTQAKNTKPFAPAAALTLFLVAIAFAGFPPAALGQSPTTPTRQPGAEGSLQIRARTPAATAAQDPAAKGRPRTTGDKTAASDQKQSAGPEETGGATATDLSAAAQANRKEQQSEENAVV